MLLNTATQPWTGEKFYCRHGFRLSKEESFEMGLLIPSFQKQIRFQQVGALTDVLRRASTEGNLHLGCSSLSQLALPVKVDLKWELSTWLRVVLCHSCCT